MQGSVFIQGDEVLAEAAGFIGQRVALQADEVRGCERFELEHLRAADQWAIDREERVLRRRAEQPHRAAFHVGQEGVLLRAVEAVDLVDEKDGPRVRIQAQAVVGGGDDAPDVGDGAFHPA